MTKKIVIPVDENGVLDAHFGHCKMLAVLNVSDNEIVSEEQLTPPPHEPGLLPKFLAEYNVTDIIAGGMGKKAIDLFKQNNINAYVGAPKMAAKILVQEFLDEELNLTSNSCDH